MVITIWKDINTLQVVSITMTKLVGRVARRKGGYSITVKCPKVVIKYQQHMGVVACGDQHILTGSGFANVAHFKKWYK